jgi:hypothetical protein
MVVIDIVSTSVAIDIEASSAHCGGKRLLYSCDCCRTVLRGDNELAKGDDRVVN